MSVLPSSQHVEACREFWANIAREHNWYKEPFYVQVWYDADGKITDSVSHRDFDQDYLVEDEDSFDYAECRVCDRVINLDTDSWTTDGDDTVCAGCK